MAKTFLMAVLTFCVQTSFAESFEDLKAPPAASQWTEAAKEIDLGAIIKKSEKNPNAAKAGNVSFTFKGNSFGATPKFPLVPSDKESGQIVYKGIPPDKLVMSDSETNRTLFQNILVEVLKVANSKDEQKANAAKLVASELLRVHHGKTLDQIAPRKVAGFAGASGILGKGKGKGGLHLGGDLDSGGAMEEGHAELPEAAPEARLLSYMENPKAWVQATDCGDGGSCRIIPGEVMNPKVGGNLAIDAKLADALNGKQSNQKQPAAAATAKSSQPQSGGYQQEFDSRLIPEGTKAALLDRLNSLPPEKTSAELYVGAQWCGPCRTKKAQMLSGSMAMPDFISFHPESSGGSELMGYVQTIPKILTFSRKPDGSWNMESPSQRSP